MKKELTQYGNGGPAAGEEKSEAGASDTARRKFITTD